MNREMDFQYGGTHLRSKSMACIVAVVLAVVVSVLLPGVPHAETMVVRMRGQQSSEDLSHGYFIGLMKLALAKTAGEYGPGRVEVIRYNAPQRRALVDLMVGEGLDVDWAGTNQKREESLRPIRIPLVGGLLGYRAPVIHRDSLEAFRKIRSIRMLGLYTAVQGTHWPDADIMEDAGLKVLRVPEFGRMYKLLRRHRVDYFPRGLNEVYAEKKALASSELLVFDSLLIAYPLPMYFFTSKSNERLAQRIEKGLRAAIKDGSFLEYMRTHPATSPMFPLSKYADSIILRIPNDDLSDETPFEDGALWFSFGAASSR